MTEPVTADQEIRTRALESAVHVLQGLCGTRYVGPCGGGEFCSHDYRPCSVALEPVLDLPDAEHIHVTRHPDGTLTATPMRPVTWMDSDMNEAWVDCPTGGDA